MTELLSAAQMRAIEEAAIASGAVTGLELMERAGRGVVAAVFEEWPDLAQAPHRAVVLCGPGNNGGDGFVVARLLKEWGWEVEVFLYGDPAKLPPDAKANYRRWTQMGEVSPLEDGRLEGYAEDNPGTALAIDALFGTGLTRPFDDLRRVREELNCWQTSSANGEAPRVVSVDIPSGICADSGRYLGVSSENPSDRAIMANLTVSFHAEKIGHRLAQGPDGCGRVVVRSIGLGGDLALPPGERVRLIGADDALHRLGKAAGSHKYGHGHALVLSGGPGRTGAARLAARAALRIGAGLVTLGVPPAAQSEVAAQVTAVMLRRIADGAALRALLEDGRLNALCLGPGLGMERARDLVPAALDTGRATVLDADALTAYAEDPAALFGMLHEDCVLTPHDGEFSRLFPDIAERLHAAPVTGPACSRVDAARAAARRAGCVVLLKGPDTVIAVPDGRCRLNSARYERAAPWLATAGTGDVLAGLITGLLARGLPPMAAAGAAAWLHVECARSFGPGLVAEDLPEELPRVFRALGL